MIRLWLMLVLLVGGLLLPATSGQARDDQQVIQVLVAYHSLTGHTERMAKAVAEGVVMVPNTRATVKHVRQVTAEELFSADAIVLGSPVYWSNMAGEVKAFIDDWQFKFGVFPEFKLKNKVGAAFVTGGQISSGKELTLLSMLAAMLGNYMIVVSGGGAFGASATTEGESPGLDENELAGGRSLGQRVAEVTLAVAHGFGQGQTRSVVR
ncbi:MAG: NAD(P)H dehydrogenase (quinone) [Nitrospirae bacterium]|nr:MAG: NAD(P)H:quinone oxidoreductase WrbA [Nitrospira sp. OLB3]MBV6470757.1 NAD(P)H dehydrogenase (quinone) [Nitrospirota bacterium]